MLLSLHSIFSKKNFTINIKSRWYERMCFPGWLADRQRTKLTTKKVSLNAFYFPKKNTVGLAHIFTFEILFSKFTKIKSIFHFIYIFLSFSLHYVLPLSLLASTLSSRTFMHFDIEKLKGKNVFRSSLFLCDKRMFYCGVCIYIFFSNATTLESNARW